ncbi:ribosome maturation factor RimP [Haliscomenobacter hydrossis]|uniref:Ribosome maturation factor RimP n=1 Tax=Haliscomenobacter hydrossis (strain ATCC 27775 / DSM 1100 / LMG 10767 / O) TaxID=760192 RepID=F4KUA4_HALH1|nr:ribosome maturation factor [Haliscomenobacter hydrossis]AEE51186.1 Ribosome maturation factor rimP [Haliscomenobacter hydrossis DSM 1100]
MITEKIEALLQEKYQEPEFADCFTIEIKQEGGNRLEVFVDSDSGMQFEKCQRISRFLEAHLDTNGWLGEVYTLEVSSPGIERPLKFARQYLRNIGRTFEVRLSAGETKTGVLKAVNPESIVLEEEIKWKEGKKNMKGTVQTVIPFEHIAKAIVKISFS